MANFSDILDTPAESIERPKPLPTGEYVFLVKGPHELKTIKRKDGSGETQVAEFQARPLQPMESVNREDLEAYGWPTEKTQRLSFFLTEDAIYRLKDFVQDVLGQNVSGMNVRQMLAVIPGQQFVGTIGNRPSDDGKQFYSEFKGFAKAG